MSEWVQTLPHVNASLNTLATILLVTGLVLIKAKRETAHKWTMLACFVVSVIFLLCYLVYHAYSGSRRFPSDAPSLARGVYFLVLISHVLLAATVPVLTIGTIYFGLTGKRSRHRKWAKWTFPIWLYVSVTGVVVYLMLYQLYAGPG